MHSFSTLGLSGDLAEAVAQLGFETPTPIQQKAIPFLLGNDRDLVALAQTGTGKTAAFGLPLIELIDDEDKTTRALVLAPTRELCLQITRDFENFSRGVKRLNVVAVYGGSSIVDQIRAIKKGAQIIVATPGRLMDLIGRKAVDLSVVRFLVLDEADEMLNMGFKDDIDHILSHTSDQKRVWLFSATMPPTVRRIANTYMDQPLELSVGERHGGNKNITHQYALLRDGDRYAALKRFVDHSADIFGVVFCRTKMEAQQVAEQLIRDGYNADALHGDLTQQQRDKVMRSFRNRGIQLLVATDVAARGIDVSDVTHVIHLNIPDEIEFYTHRSGRTGRAGKTGVSLALVNRRELSRIRQIEKAMRITFEKVAIPTGQEVCEQRLLKMVTELREVNVAHPELAELASVVDSQLAELSREELISRFLALQFNNTLEYYRNAPDLNVTDGGRETEELPMGDRVFINLGKMDGFDAGKMLALICDRCDFSRDKVGRIELKGAYSFFQIADGFTERVKQRLHGISFKGRTVRIEATADRPPKNKGGFAKKGHRKTSKKAFRV
jgi:ATP-dependent RNA helicase DeaD